MSLKEIVAQQQKGLEYMAGYGVMGLHLVSGPVVGLAMGYGLDYWLGTSPWCKLIFLLLGIIAGFLNVYRDARHILGKMHKADALRRGDAPAAAQAPVSAAAAVGSAGQATSTATDLPVNTAVRDDGRDPACGNGAGRDGAAARTQAQGRNRIDAP